MFTFAQTREISQVALAVVSGDMGRQSTRTLHFKNAVRISPSVVLNMLAPALNVIIGGIFPAAGANGRQIADCFAESNGFVRVRRLDE